jgi:hypothetical protein
MKPRFNQTSGKKKPLPKVDASSLGDTPDNLFMVPIWLSSAPAAMWNLHTTQPKYFAPTSSEVVNLTGLL